MKIFDWFALIRNLPGIRHRNARHFPQYIGNRLVSRREKRAYIIIDGIAVRIDFLRLYDNLFQFDGAVLHNDFIITGAVGHCNL